MEGELVRSNPPLRFNPPPNWPQLPAGWTPPLGWEPDPSWPRPPAGWQLWVAEEEFVITPRRAASSPSPSRVRAAQPWYRRTGFVVLLLVVFFPVGLVLLWQRPDWSVRRRGIVTAVVAVVALIFAVGTTNQQPTSTTTVLGPTATASSSATQSQSQSPSPSPTQSPSASQSASPSSAATSAVATTSTTTTTSAARKTTSAPVVHTSAAPVHTTKTAQPVQTTPHKASCYPLTNSGKCYTPGEFCRTSDHSVSGIDANGDAIKCEDNDGWRWERV
jgi:hypothetical protein